MKFTHFIISRFNLIPNGNYKKKVNEKWMVFYWKLFSKFCYPSVVKQSNQNFEWIVLFDYKLTKNKKEIEKKFPRITPLYVKRYNIPLSIILSNFIKKRTLGNWIMTSRIDIDDCYHEDFVDLTQKNFKIHNRILNYPDGFIRDIKTNEIRRVYWEYPTPFISVIEKNNSEFKTCLYTKHTKMREIFPKMDQLRFYAGPLWMQNIHGKNVSNILQGEKVINLDNF